jgi:hypothetical protein
MDPSRAFLFFDPTRLLSVNAYQLASAAAEVQGPEPPFTFEG